MTAASSAILPLTEFHLLERREMFRPAVTRTASAFQSVKAFTGLADQDLHDWQWQYPIVSGSPETST